MRRWLLALCLLLACVAPALARVGGGGSYSGGGGGGGSGGGGGGGELVWDLIQLLFYLCVDYPIVGIPVVIAVVVVGIWIAMQPPAPTYSSTPGQFAIAPTPGRLDFKALRAADPNFSEPLFIDFIQLLYTRFQGSRGKHQFDSVAAFVEPGLLGRLQADTQYSSVVGVEDVVIGASRILGLAGLSTPVTSMSIHFKVNYVELRADGTKAPLYVEDVWVVQRQAGVQSLPPDRMRSLNCPNCGSPMEMDPSGRCKSCSQIVNQGNFQWQLQSVETRHKGPRPPLQLSAGVEAGTYLPTVLAPDLDAARQSFTARYPDFSSDAFERQVRDTFMQLQTVWAARTWEKARPYETDSLFNQHRFWIEKYLHEGLVNHLEDISVKIVEVAKIETDAYYDAITVRIWADMKDYTTNSAGQVVDGDAKTPRRFTEYWTFIRSSGFKSGATPGASKAPGPHCPNCGSPLDISMTGVCKYCDSVITTGQFGWVLSAIQQDSEYRG